MKSPKIIFEDSSILVIDKPVGMVVNRAEMFKKRTLQDWLERKLQATTPEGGQASYKQQATSSKQQEKDKAFIEKFWMVHRLDKDTSGLMVIAKTRQAYLGLGEQFRQGKVIKKYLAVVHGVVAAKGKIQTKIAKDFRDRKKFRVSSFGKESLTNFRPLMVFKNTFAEKLSLLEVTPKTGRTHQIRVHLAGIGHPIVGDRTYLSFKLLKKDRRWSSRLLLHAFYLSFVHPGSGRRVEYKIQVPKVFRRFGKKRLLLGICHVV